MSLQNKIYKVFFDKNIPKYQKLSDILKLLINYCNINNKKYMIIGSYSIRDYREINDLDMNMEANEWNKLTKLVNMGLGIIEIYNNQYRYFFDMTEEYKKIDPNANDFSIEIFKKEMSTGFPDDTFSIEYLIKNKGLDKDNNKHLFFNKETLLRWKKTMNRAKDQKDIELLETLIKKFPKRMHKNDNKLKILFEQCIKYGYYTRYETQYKVDHKLKPGNGLEFWNKIKILFNDDKCGNWNINNIIQDSNSNSYIESDINKIYQYLHNILRILGDDNDDNDKNDEMHPWKFHHFFLQTIRIPKNNHASLLRICQIAYNIGQLSVYINKKYIYIPTFFKKSSSLPNIFRKNAIKYYYKNKLYKIESYLDVSKIDYTKIDFSKYDKIIEVIESEIDRIKEEK